MQVLSLALANRLQPLKLTINASIIMDPVKRSLYSLHLTVILLGGTALFSQIIPLSAMAITLGRSFFACVFLYLLVRILGESMRLDSKRDYLMGALLGIVMAAHWVTYFLAMQLSSVSVGIIALFTFPVITVLLEPIFEGIKLAWQDICSALVVFIGIAIMVPDVSFDNDVTLGIGVGVFSAFLYSLRYLMHRKFFAHYSGTRAMAYQTLIVTGCIALLGIEEIATADAHTWGLLAALGIFFTAVPHAAVAAALRHLRAKTFSLVACMQPFYGVVFAILLLDEDPRWQTIVGGLMVISAAVYETINTQRAQQSAKA